MFAKEFEELFSKVVKGFEDKAEAKPTCAFLDIDGKTKFLVATRSFLAVLHEPEDTGKEEFDPQNLKRLYENYIKTQGQSEFPHEWGLSWREAIYAGRASKLFGFDYCKEVEVDYVKFSHMCLMRIKDKLHKITFVLVLRAGSAHVPEWAK